MSDSNDHERNLIKCDSLTEPERFARSDDAYKGTVVILFSIPSGWKWRIFHINTDWEDSRFSGFEPLPLIRLFPNDAIKLLREGMVEPATFAPPMKVPSIYQVPVPWDEWGGYFAEDFFATSFLKLLKVDESKNIDHSAKLKLILSDTFMEELQTLDGSQEEWLNKKHLGNIPEVLERPFKIRTKIPLQNLKNAFEELAKQNWITGPSALKVDAHFTNSNLDEQKECMGEIVWCAGLQKLKAFRLLLYISPQEIIEHFEKMDKKSGSIDPINISSLKGGLNATDKKHQDAVWELMQPFLA